MASTIKVDNVQNQPGTNIVSKCGTTITLGQSGDTVNLASGASQSGFGRTGTVDWETSIQTSTITAATGKGYFVNTTGGAITANLPAGAAGSIVSFKDYAQTFDTYALTISANGSEKIEGQTFDLVLSTEGQAVTLVYGDAVKGWQAVNSNEVINTPQYITATGGTIITCGDYKTHIFTGPGTFSVTCSGNPAGNATLDYFVVAAGGGGGLDTYPASRIGGGGGAGGFRISNCATRSGIATPVMSPLVTTTGLSVTAVDHPVTVGAGGTAGSGTSSPGVSGGRGNSSVFGPITSTGGGGGGGHTPGPGGPTCQTPGGSGGAFQGAIPCGTKGLGNTPPVSPPQGNNAGDGGAAPTYVGGGGGGAGAVGGNQSGGTGGTGGAGSFISDSVIGPTAPSYGEGGPVSNTRYFAGGGGSAGPGGPAAGGVGGGGNGAESPAQNGSTNMGGGAGGRRNTGGTGAGTGGSGIVILRYKYQN